MKVLVLGNGFDIAHGLPTKYKDFLKLATLAKKGQISWRDNKPEWVRKIDKEEDKEYLKSVCFSMGIDLWEEFSKLSRYNFWIKHFQNRKQILGENWINFEDEIKLVLNTVLTEIEQSKNELIDIRLLKDEEIIELCKARSLQKNNCTFRNLYNCLLKEHKNLIRMLEIYMDGYINRFPIKQNKFITKLEVEKVLSFNYTNIYTQNYNPDVECCYIHGKANWKNKTVENNMVLGFDDHYMEDTTVIPDFIPFEKYYQRIVNRTDNQYFDWLEELENNNDNVIHIYGHSLGPTDGDVLRLFILQKNVVVKIYYYNDIDRAEKIKNLAVVLGPNNLILFTGGKNPVIEFVKTGN